LPQNPTSSALPQPVPRDAPTEPPDALLAQARTAVQAGSFSSAEAMSGNIFSQQDASADGHYLLGYILSREVKAKESLAEYTRAHNYALPQRTTSRWSR